MRIFTIILVTLFLNLIANAQTVDDALRYSNFNYNGTASSIATANSFNAFGADIGALHMNPAGLATFRKNYFIVTPSWSSNNTNSSIVKDNDFNHSRSSYDFNMNNLGFVFASSDLGSNWTHSNVAIGLTNLGNFNEEFFYEGKTEGSITERFIEKANDLTYEEMDEFEAYPAYNVGAIYDDGFGNNNYISDISNLSTKVQKEQLVRRNGTVNELAFGWGGTYNNKLNLGFSLGVPFVSFEEVKQYNESDENNEIPSFHTLKYKEYLSTDGVGFNMKFGAQYSILNNLRIGLSIQSPTWYALTDEYYSDLNYQYVQDSEFLDYTYESKIGNFKYKLASPMTSTASIGYLFNTGSWKGFVNVDVDVKDYTTNRFNLVAFDNEGEQRFQDELNEEIDTELGLGVNYRIGGEIAYDWLRLRLGYASIGSPFEVDDISNSKNVYSVGTGFRSGNTYIDIAYKYSYEENGYIPYLVLDNDRNQLVNNESTTGQLALTLGFNF